MPISASLSSVAVTYTSAYVTGSINCLERSKDRYKANSWATLRVAASTVFSVFNYLSYASRPPLIHSPTPDGDTTYSDRLAFPGCVLLRNCIRLLLAVNEFFMRLLTYLNRVFAAATVRIYLSHSVVYVINTRSVNERYCSFINRAFTVF